jgi:hypothetical protein
MSPACRTVPYSIPRPLASAVATLDLPGFSCGGDPGSWRQVGGQARLSPTPPEPLRHPGKSTLLRILMGLTWPAQDVTYRLCFRNQPCRWRTVIKHRRQCVEAGRSACFRTSAQTATGPASLDQQRRLAPTRLCLRSGADAAGRTLRLSSAKAASR